MMDFQARIDGIRQAQALYGQARASVAAQEDSAALDLFIACTAKLQAAYETEDLEPEEIAELLEVGVGELAEFREELIGATVRQAFMNATDNVRDPDEAQLHIGVIENAYALHDDDVSFSEFCREMRIDQSAFETLKAEIAQMRDHQNEWHSGGAKMVHTIVGASLRRAFKWAAEFAQSRPTRALKIIEAMEWVARKVGGEDRQTVYSRAGLDARMIANMRNDLALFR